MRRFDVHDRLRSRTVRSAALSTVVVAAAAALAGCGGSSSGAVSAPTIGAAKVFSLGGFQPTGTIQAGKPVTMSFTVKMPNGRPLTQYKTGSGPHTGVHLIIVRDDLAYINHQHPPVGPNGLLRQTVTFPAPGPYRVLIDLYPNLPGGQPNFQLFRTVNVAGAYHPRTLPRFKADQMIDGYHVDMHGKPSLHAIQAQFVNIAVTDARGQNVKFVPWFGALAHAIFFHEGTLDYFHTHVCAPNAPNCATLLGSAKISGKATAPGKLTIGVLLPEPGTWRLFLQMKLGGKIVTAPYTLKVAS
jgi:hypothetical protein